MVWSSILMICSSRFLKRLSCSTFLIATSFCVCRTTAWYTTPNEPLPMMCSLSNTQLSGSAFSPELLLPPPPPTPSAPAMRRHTRRDDRMIRRHRASGREEARKAQEGGGTAAVAAHVGKKIIEQRDAQSVRRRAGRGRGVGT